MLIGTLGAMAHGCGWPALNIIFGNMIDSFTEFDRNETYNATLPPGFDPYKEFDKEMQEYAIIFSYIGAGVLVAAYFQVFLFDHFCIPENCKHRLPIPSSSRIMTGT